MEVCEYKYPFDRPIHQSQTLFYIHTGKAAPNEVKTCLLGIRHTGEERYKNFVRECLGNPTHFEEPTKRSKLFTFKQELGINNRRSTIRKIAELKCSRDLMGRLDFWFLPPGDISTSVPFDYSATSHCVTVMGRWSRQRMRSDLQDHRTTTDTPGQFQRCTQITIIQNGIAYIPAE